MQRDRKVVAASWLATAERDLRVGHATLAIEPSLSAFHAQQAAEKALKAMLVLVADDHPRTHAATTLVRELIVFDASVRELEADSTRGKSWLGCEPFAFGDRGRQHSRYRRRGERSYRARSVRGTGDGRARSIANVDMTFDGDPSGDVFR